MMEFEVLTNELEVAHSENKKLRLALDLMQARQEKEFDDLSSRLHDLRAKVATHVHKAQRDLKKVSRTSKVIKK